MTKKIFQKGAIQEGIPIILLILLLIGVVIFLFYGLKPALTPPGPSIVTPLSPTVTPGKITLQTPLTDAKITLEFWDDLGRRKIAGPVTQLTDSEGRAQLDAEAMLVSLIAAFPPGDYPLNVRADIILEKDGSRLHFQVDLDASRGALFWVEKEGGELIINKENTEFYPLNSPGPGASLEESMAASLHEVE